MKKNIFYDPKDIEAISSIKTVLEYCNMVPGFIERLQQDPQAVIKELNLDLTPEDISFYPNHYYKDECLTARYPDSKGPIYAKFINDKFKYLDVLKDRCTPVNASFKKWRDRQVGRSAMELGAKFSAMVHAPFISELADGCSVGCEFCGLGAGRLKSVFRYTEENAKLFREVMQVVCDVIGQDAGAGTMYFATEPLDNPDYEKFLEEYLKIFNYTPQITTAASIRNIERMHKLLAVLNERSDVIYRFSVTSLEMFETIMKNFSKEELILVELLSQYDEAPGNNFVNSGRNAERMMEKRSEDDSLKESDEDEYSDTICCASGFKLNFCRKEVSLITPTWASKEHPTGEIYLDRANFTDAEDLRKIMLNMISKHMMNIIGVNDRLMLRPNIQYSINEAGEINIDSGKASEYKLEANRNSPMYRMIFDSVRNEYKTRREIVNIVLSKADEYNLIVDAQTVFYILNRLWNMGLFILESGKI